MTALLRSGAIAVVFLLLGALPLRADSYPSRQVELVVAYPAGGTADVIARSLAQQLSQMWGETVVVDNRGGGATQIAASAIAQSPGDGYRLLVTGMETFAIAPFLYANKLPYDRSTISYRSARSAIRIRSWWFQRPHRSRISGTCSAKPGRKMAVCSTEPSESVDQAISTWCCWRISPE